MRGGFDSLCPHQSHLAAPADPSTLYPMKSFRLWFSLACLSVLAASYSWAEEPTKPADQPKEQPACTCCCCKAKAAGTTCTEHQGCCCQKQKACDQAAKPDQAKPAEPKAN